MFVNGARLDVPSGALVIDVVRKWDAAAAQELERGARSLTDSRGLPLDPQTPAIAGTIVRVIAARGADAEHDAEHDAE